MFLPRPGKVQPRSAQSITARIMQRGGIAGLQLSNDGSAPNTTVDVAAGVCRDSTDAADITLGAFTKTKSNPFVAGTGNAGAAVAIGSSTWAHVFAALVNGVADVFLDTSITAANKPSGTTAFRRIGSILTDGSGNIKTFKQVYNTFFWGASILDNNGAIASAAGGTLITMSTPLGIKCGIICNVVAPIPEIVQFTSPSDQPDEAPSGSAAPLEMLGQNAGSGPGMMLTSIFTNTSSQIRARTSGGATIRVATLGYVDYRGQYD